MLVAFVLYWVLLDYESLMMYVFLFVIHVYFEWNKEVLDCFCMRTSMCTCVCCEHVHLKLSAMMMWCCVWCWTCKSVWMPCTTHKCVTAATQRVSVRVNSGHDVTNASHWTVCCAGSTCDADGRVQKNESPHPRLPPPAQDHRGQERRPGMSDYIWWPSKAFLRLPDGAAVLWPSANHGQPTTCRDGKPFFLFLRCRVGAISNWVLEYVSNAHFIFIMVGNIFIIIY